MHFLCKSPHYNQITFSIRSLSYVGLHGSASVFPSLLLWSYINQLQQLFQLTRINKCLLYLWNGLRCFRQLWHCHTNVFLVHTFLVIAMATRISLKGKERYELGKDWYDKATTIPDTPYSAVLCQSYCVFESRKQIVQTHYNNKAQSPPSSDCYGNQ